MKMQFSKDEVLAILLKHAQYICPTGKFNHVQTQYSYLDTVTVEYVEQPQETGANNAAQ